MSKSSPSSLQQLYEKYLKRLKKELQSTIPKQCSSTEDAVRLLNAFSEETKLIKYIVLKEATPAKLAKFASLSVEHEQLIRKYILEDSYIQVLKDMLLADGPTDNQYGPALQIFDEIAKESDSNLEGVLYQLAIAVSVVHAVPQLQRNAEQPPPSPTELHVDPLARYLNYELAYQEGQLDPCFVGLDGFSLKFVVDGEEPDSVSYWGRQMLQNYRPDHILAPNETWRYVGFVRTNIRYGSQNVKHDRPELQFFQNILLNGGVCGRRAFIGRFLLRSFGVPTTARPSKGHGALCHYTTNGWVVNLGPSWGCGTTKTIYKKDLDFEATTKARLHKSEYWNVKRSQWFGTFHNERKLYGQYELEEDKQSSTFGYWYKLSLQIQKDIIDQPLPLTTRPHSSITTIAEQINSLSIQPSSIKYYPDGTIIIPATAFVGKPKDVQVMKSFDKSSDGQQMYLPDFAPVGLTIVRGGTFKNDPHGCCSGARLKSGGYGKYHDWGMRLAMSAGDATDDDDHPTRHKARAKSISIEIGKIGKIPVMVEMKYVPPGTFIMGGDNDKDGRFECIEVPKHKVTLTKGCYLGKYPVTQQQYQVVMGDNPSKSTKDPNCPVDNIGIDEANEYIQKLVDTVGRDFRLPTEAGTVTSV
jgi:hypothetical protein